MNATSPFQELAACRFDGKLFSIPGKKEVTPGVSCTAANHGFEVAKSMGAGEFVGRVFFGAMSLEHRHEPRHDQIRPGVVVVEADDFGQAGNSATASMSRQGGK